MEMRVVASVGALLLLAVNTTARSLAPVDVPDPPLHRHLSVCPEAVPEPVVRPEVILKPAVRPEVILKPAVRPEVILKPAVRPEVILKSVVRPEVILKPAVRPEVILKPAVTPEIVPRSFVKPKQSGVVSKSIFDNAATTTTLDPFHEFCREACKEGVGGPECDCPDHPVGPCHAPPFPPTLTESQLPDDQDRIRQAPAQLPGDTDRIRQAPAQLPGDTDGIRQAPAQLPGDTDGIRQAPAQLPGDTDGTRQASAQLPGDHDMEHYHPPKPRRPKVPGNDGGDVIGGNVTGSHDSVPTTTKDSLSDFCEVACKEGRGSLACDCPNHIIGRRSVRFFTHARRRLAPSPYFVSDTFGDRVISP
ncbi:uncharacterized protein LOC121861847 isoform X2 [Homarus americanus]|uniref:uncharacterized protein LOC121861847 isoform X2 n=1 Tax=Homarus americanus TaxID=6706 RepID=UPI001C45DBAD|nr:uncharacterized protein LOC121861847 isoform X2 [Homarus americanus]